MYKCTFGIWSPDLEPSPQTTHNWTGKGTEKSDTPSTPTQRPKLWRPPAKAPTTNIKVKKTPRWHDWDLYKLLHDIYDPILPKLLDPVEKSKTRGYSFKLPKKSTKNNIKGHVFSHRIVNDWNSLPEDVVSAPSVNAFKSRLDSHWRNHPWLYNWEAELELRPNRLSQACAPHGNKNNV